MKHELMSCSMKHDAIVGQGIPINERVPIPDELIPEDSRVEIDAKIHAGYCPYYSALPSYHILTCYQLPPVRYSQWKSYQTSKAEDGRTLIIEGDALVF